MLAALTFLLIAQAVPPEQPEPGLPEVQEAAARHAGGDVADDLSRTVRARRSHWAPQVRGQAGTRDDETTRAGQRSNAPLTEQDLLVGHTWAVMVSWDFSQVVYAREESQIALAHAHLARVRREAAQQAGALFIERKRARLHYASLAAGPPRLDACLTLLRLTSELDALTGGLFRDAVTRTEAACALEEK